MIKGIDSNVIKNIFSKENDLVNDKTYKASVIKKVVNNNFIIKVGKSNFFKVKLPLYIQEGDFIELFLLSKTPKYKFKFLRKIDDTVIYEKNSVKKTTNDNNFIDIIKKFVGDNKNLLNLVDSYNTKSMDNSNFNNLIYFVFNNNYFIPLKIDDNEFYCTIKKNKDYDIIKIAFFLNNEYYVNVLIYKDKTKLIINFFSNNKNLLNLLDSKKNLFISTLYHKEKKECNFNKVVKNKEKERNKNKIEVKFFYEK